MEVLFIKRGLFLYYKKSRIMSDVIIFSPDKLIFFRTGNPSQVEPELKMKFRKVNVRFNVSEGHGVKRVAISPLFISSIECPVVTLRIHS